MEYLKKRYQSAPEINKLPDNKSPDK